MGAQAWLKLGNHVHGTVPSINRTMVHKVTVLLLACTLWITLANHRDLLLTDHEDEIVMMRLQVDTGGSAATDSRSISRADGALHTLDIDSRVDPVAKQTLSTQSTDDIKAELERRKQGETNAAAERQVQSV